MSEPASIPDKFRRCDSHVGPIGIEIVDVAIPESVQLAQEYAAEHGLPFPKDISSAVRSISTK
jgi:hypothetical protein